MKGGRRGGGEGEEREGERGERRGEAWTDGRLPAGYRLVTGPWNDRTHDLSKRVSGVVRANFSTAVANGYSTLLP